MNYIFTMFICWVMAGWILDFQHGKWVLNFLHYFFNIKKAFYSILLRNTIRIVKVGIGVSTPLKTTIPSFLPNCPSLLFKQSSLCTGLLWTLPKSGIFIEPEKYEFFSSSTPSYLLKVTKFLVGISQFEFLVMTEKNIFCS